MITVNPTGGLIPCQGKIKKIASPDFLYYSGAYGLLTAADQRDSGDRLAVQRRPACVVSHMPPAMISNAIRAPIGADVFHDGRKRVMTKESPVTVYSLSTCSHCKSTKKMLSECTIKYEFVDVDLLEGDERKAILEDVKKFNPKCSFPTIIIGDKVIVGFKEKEIKEALGL
jgi:glutaredoxin-like protein NrdH